MLRPRPFQRAQVILTPSQKEKKQKEVEETAKKALLVGEHESGQEGQGRNNLENTLGGYMR